MTHTRQATRTAWFTIAFALTAALLFPALVLLLRPLAGTGPAVRFLLWACFTAYGLLTALGNGAGPGSVVFPALVSLTGAILLPGTMAYAVLATVLLAWMRSGSLLGSHPVRVALLETLFCGAAVAVVLAMAPQVPGTWAVTVWLMFLVQAPFGLFAPERPSRQGRRRETAPGTEENGADIFETSRRAVEELLGR